MGVIQRTTQKSPYDLDIDHLCGKFAAKLKLIFEGNIQAILTTPASRRQVWYAVLANTSDTADLKALAEPFLFEQSKALIAQAYGRSPASYLTVLKRIGVQPFEASWYQDLHTILSDIPEIAVQILNIRKLDSIVTILAQLPPKFRDVKFASKFYRGENVEEFLCKYGYLCDLVGIKNKDTYLQSRISVNISPENILKALYEKVEFEPPVLQETNELEYLGSVKKMKAAADEFNNCLRDRIELAFCNAHQHYTLTLEEDKCVFSIQKMADGKWQLFEMEDKNSFLVGDYAEHKINTILEKHGVTKIERFSQLAA